MLKVVLWPSGAKVKSGLVWSQWQKGFLCSLREQFRVERLEVKEASALWFLTLRGKDAKVSNNMNYIETTKTNYEFH